MQKKKATRAPGRPAGDSSAREKILDAAEELFAERGFSATTLRDLAELASVNAALIAYYFGTKRGLFETAFKRRGYRIAERRLELLEALERRPGREPSVEELIHAYLLPQCEMKDSGPRGLIFVRLQARIHHEPEESAFRLRREVYDASTKRYIDALERALPSVDPADINWRMMFAIGAYLYMLSGVDRLNDLSDGRYRQSERSQEFLRRFTSFVAAGMRAPTTSMPTWPDSRTGSSALCLLATVEPAES